MADQLYPTAFNSTVSDTDRLERLNNPAVRGGILMNLDANLFVTNSIMRESIPKGNMFKEFWRYSDIGSEIHDVGDEILAMGTKRRKRKIFLDDRPRVSKDTFDDIEEFLSDWSAQQKTAERMGVELAQHAEIRAMKLPLLASREAKLTDDFIGGGIDGNGKAVDIGTGNAATRAGILLNKLDTIDRYWFDISMNDANRTVWIESDIWYALRDRDDVFPGDKVPFFHGDVTQSASPSPADLAGPQAELRYKGFRIVRSQLEKRVLGKNLSDDRYEPGDFTDTLGVAYTPECAALIISKGVSVEAYRTPENLANHIQSSLMLGGGTIYPEKAIEIIGTVAGD